MIGTSIARRKILLSLLFAGLLATPLVLKRTPTLRANPEPDTKSAALSRYGFFMEEVSHAAGIDFVHHAPTLDRKLAPIMPEVASMGASVSIVDYDRDGWPDIYVVDSREGGRNALYHNLRDGT